jgi:hypothetical protein
MGPFVFLDAASERFPLQNLRQRAHPARRSMQLPKIFLIRKTDFRQ